MNVDRKTQILVNTLAKRSIKRFATFSIFECCSFILKIRKYYTYANYRQLCNHIKALGCSCNLPPIHLFTMNVADEAENFWIHCLSWSCIGRRGPSRWCYTLSAVSADTRKPQSLCSSTAEFRPHICSNHQFSKVQTAPGDWRGHPGWNTGKVL